MRQGQEQAFAALAEERGVPCVGARDGRVQPNPALTVEGLFDIPLDELRAAHTGHPARPLRLTGLATPRLA